MSEDINTNVCKLSEMLPGEQGKVIKIVGEGDIHRRLLDMGLVRGVPIIVAKIAPLGDPLSIFVKGFQLSLRKLEAEMVVVQKC